jgi:hypothetical protein
MVGVIGGIGDRLIVASSQESRGIPSEHAGASPTARSPPSSASVQAIAVPDKTFRRRLYETPVRRRRVIASGSGSSVLAGATAAERQ